MSPWSSKIALATCGAAHLMSHSRFAGDRSSRSIVRSEGAVMALAHPMRPFRGRHASRDRFEEWFGAFETINGDHADTEGGPFEQLAQRIGIGIGSIGGSDVHSEQAVGRAVTACDGPVAGIEDLVDQLRARITRPRDLRPRRPAPGPSSSYE